MQTAFSISTEAVLVGLLLQIAVILTVAKCVGALFVRMGQSRSIGEILAGVMLGPSLLGWLAPSVFAGIFASTGGPPILPWLSHIGLVLALFIIGMEFDFQTALPHAGKVAGVAVATLVAPLIAAALLTPWLWSIAPGAGSRTAYTLFVGMTLAITAIPIMGRILMELGLTSTRVGVLGITTGAFKDLLTWFLLAIVSGIARPPLDPWRIVTMVAASVCLAGLALTVGRRIVQGFQRRWGWEGDRPSGAMLSFLLVLLVLFAAATAKIGIFAIFGAFLAGVMVSSDRRLAHAASDRLHDLTIHLFLPIFFTYTGLRCDLSTLEGPLWLAMLVVTVVGSLSCGGVAWLLARRSGLSGPESRALGALINTPGLMVLILLNLGLDLGVIPSALFAVLVGNAMLRNLAVTPVLRRARTAGLPRA